MQPRPYHRRLWHCVSAVVIVALGASGYPRRLLKKAQTTLREPQGERKSSIDSGRGSAHAEALEAWGGVFQQPARPRRSACSVPQITTDYTDPSAEGFGPQAD